MADGRVTLPIGDASEPWDDTPNFVRLDASFVSSLIGLAEIMTLARMWEGSEEDITNMIYNFRNGIGDLMVNACCDDAIVSMGQSKGSFLKSQNAAGDTFILQDTITAEAIERMPAEQATDNTDDNVCAGVNLVVDRLLDEVLFSLDQAQLITDQFKTGAEGLNAIINSMGLFGAPTATLLDGWEEWVTTAISLTISTLKVAYSDPAVKSKMRENMYCNITASIGNTFVSADYFGAVADLPLLESQGLLLSRFMQGFEILSSGEIFATVERWYNLGCLNEDNTCAAEFDCIEEWCLGVNLLSNDGGFEVQEYAAAGGVWGSGVGWTSTQQAEGGGYHTNIVLRLETPEATFTEMELEYSYTRGVMNGDGTFPWYLAAGSGMFYDAPATTAEPDSPWLAFNAGATGTVMIIQIPVGVDTSPTGGTAVLTRVKVRGTGEKPTITGWSDCE